MTRFLAALFGNRCPLCRERRRYLMAHLHIDHPGGV